MEVAYSGLEEVWCDDAAPVRLDDGKALVKGEKASEEEAAELGLVDQASPFTSAGLMGSSGEMG